MAKNIKEHMENCKQVSTIIDDANALLTKTRAELTQARSVLESLLEYQHPKLVIKSYTVKQVTKNETASPKELINCEIARINELLGDRA